MDELVGRIVTNVGVDRSFAEKAVGIILEFLAKEGPADKVQVMLERLPGATEVLERAASGGAGSFGGMGGIMGVGSRLMSVGLDMGQIRGVTHELIAYAREKAGDEAVGGIVESIPGLSQFI